MEYQDKRNFTSIFFTLYFNGNIMSQNSTDKTNQETTEQATLGGGCFWCIEAVYKEVIGVKKVLPGYSGGSKENPTYQEVCSRETGHAEVIQLEYDSSVISYHDLLEIFWSIHDPTTINRQGADIGTQYRSVIFYHNEQQRKIAQTYKDELNRLNTFENPIVTTIVPFENFYPAEKYHNNYYENNKNQPYCKIVISPKLEKFKKTFKSIIKKD